MSGNSLALFGGKALRPKPFYSYNTIGEAEKKAVMEVLDSGELSGFTAGNTDRFYGGEKVRKLEEDFCKYFGVKYAVAVNSATSALHCAVSAMGVGPGDEVITSPYTMTASATCILMCGAVPIFADINEDTFCLDPKEVEKKITPNTKGIVAVNILGHPCDFDELKRLAEKHNLFIVEDNAQGPDAHYKGEKTATIGDAGVFSFNRHKAIQSGEGGVMLTNDKDIFFKACCMRNHGEYAVEGFETQDIVNTIGVNYRMTEMEAAVAIEQFKKLPEINERRIERANRLTAGLREIDGITPPYVQDNCRHVYYFYGIRYDEKITGISREDFVSAMNAEGLQLRSGYLKPVYWEPLFQKKICFGKNGFPFTANNRNSEISYAKGSCPIVERIQNNEMMVTGMINEPYTLEDMDLFIKAAKKVIANKHEFKK